jgi:predicted RNA-binding Zn ribbon-like protein
MGEGQMAKCHCAILAVLLLSGCQHVMLERRTLAQASTLTDIQYTLVLNNLAMFTVNPDALPYFSATAAGSNNNQQTGELTPTLGWDLLLNAATFRFDKVSSALRASRTTVQTWNTTSVLNPDELSLMRCAYQKTLGCSNEICDEHLQAYFKPRPEFLSAMQPGWFCVGSRNQVPHGAPYVGCYHDAYVWVKPGGENHLTLLTLAILDLANAVPSSGSGSAPRISFDQTDADIKKYQDQAQAIVNIIDKAPNKNAKSVVKLQEILEERVLQRLDTLLSGATKRGGAAVSMEMLEVKPELHELTQPPGAPSMGAAEAPLIRERPSIMPFPVPPVVIPNPQ